MAVGLSSVSAHGHPCREIDPLDKASADHVVLGIAGDDSPLGTCVTRSTA